MSIHPTSPSSSLFPPSFVPLLVQLPPDSASGSSAPPPQIFTLFHQPPLPSERTLVFLHGYPQNGTLWWDVVRGLEAEGVLEGWNVVIPDLPGYGRSTKTPSPDGSHLAHSKLSIAANLISLLDLLLGPTSQFLLVGHDRGARVGYKLTKDFPNRVKGLCVQDIVPTRSMFERMKLEEGGHEETFKSYHWIFLALPSPLPETLINANPSFYFRHTIQSWTGKNGDHILSGDAMDSWVGQYNDPEVVQGALEDYRAGASLDLLHDELDSLDPSGGKVQTELLVLYSVHLSKRFDVEKVWNALRGEGKGIKVVKIGDEGTGHFLPVEAAKEVTKELMEFMKRCE